jgi:sigma-B regulation protein RsbU (phosphoserine phosphatase)
MVEARAVVRAMASVSSSPAEILRGANRVLLQDLQRGMFITLFYAHLDLSKGILRTASAGHTPMLLRRASTGKCYSINPSGLVLGAANEETFNQTCKEQTVQLQPGDRFVLYTDGVTELMDLDEEEFGMRRLVECSVREGGRTSSDFVHALVRRLEEHRSGLDQSDDITVVTGRVYPESEML